MEQIPGHPLWIFEGAPVSFYGFPYPTRMVVIRLSGDRLFIHSPIGLTDDLRRQVDELGKVAYLISPNKIHHLFLGPWKEAYPDARVYASPGLRPRRKDLEFDDELSDQSPNDWADEIDQIVLRGSWAMEEVEFFHRSSKTLILADIIQKIDPAIYSPVKRLLMKANNLCAPDGQAPREWRISFIGGRDRAREAVCRMLDWNPERVIIAHGAWCRENGREFLESGFRWLLG